MFKDCNGKTLKVNDVFLVIKEKDKNLIGLSGKIIELINQGYFIDNDTSIGGIYQDIVMTNLKYNNKKMAFTCKSIMKISPESSMSDTKKKAKHIDK